MTSSDACAVGGGGGASRMDRPHAPFRRLGKGLSGLLVAVACVSGCGGSGGSGQPTPTPTPQASPTPHFDLSRFYFPISIDYANPSLYVQSGTQSTLTAENAALVTAQISVPTRDIASVGRIHEWIRTGFVGEAAGGRTIGITDVNDLIRDRVVRGCHDSGLLLSTLLRHFGFPAVMVDTAGIQWADDFNAGRTRSYSGHVYVEVYLDGRWILVNSNNPVYAANYDVQEPVFPATMQGGDSRGHYVLCKGVDPAGYGITSNAVMLEKMRQFATVYPTLTLTFPVYDVRPLPDT